MCFVCFHSWIVCTIYDAAPMLFFRLRNFLMRISAFPLCPRYIRCSTTCLLPSLSKKLLYHFGVIINNPYVTPVVIFLLNNWTFILTYVTAAICFSIPLVLLVLMFLNNKHPTITVSMCMSPPLVLT